MLNIVLSALIPLFLMVLAGAIAYRYEILPENTASVLNAFVYYFTLPALLFWTMATTPFQEIAQIRFILGYLSAMVFAYWGMFFLSGCFFNSHFTENAMRATTGSFPNSAYLGLPVMMYLFDGGRLALIATTLAIILPLVVIIMTLVSFALHGADKSKPTYGVVASIAFSMLKNPIVFACAAGTIFSFFGLALPSFISSGLKSFGLASVPCALFAIGGLVARQKMKLDIKRVGLVNVYKLVVHPLMALAFLHLFEVEGQLLLMGILLSGMPSATLACVLAETYKVREAETAASVLVSMVLYIPALLGTLVLAESFGLALG